MLTLCRNIRIGDGFAGNPTILLLQKIEGKVNAGKIPARDGQITRRFGTYRKTDCIEIRE